MSQNAALHRLLARVGREAARHEKFEKTAPPGPSRERAYGEANVLRMVQGFIREELAKEKARP